MKLEVRVGGYKCINRRYMSPLALVRLWDAEIRASVFKRHGTH